MNGRHKLIFFVLIWLFFAIFVISSKSSAGSPSGSNWFQLLTNPYTGGDNTGDGGTGNIDDYNYYYVGQTQTFTATIQIDSTGTNAANIWIDYDPNLLNSANLTNGSYFPQYAGQTTTPINSSTTRIRLTGFDLSNYHSGIGTFGTVKFTPIKPSADHYKTTSPAVIAINVGILHQTTESNISYQGTDILGSYENFNLHIWADTIKPYATSSNPASGSSNIAVDTPYTFSLIDSKNGNGDPNGVGTGVDTDTGNVSVNDGVNTYIYNSTTPALNFSCSGIWGSNLCNSTLSLGSPLGIPGDARKWNYDTAYTVTIGAFNDFASTHQDQLGDANGPNTMTSTSYTFHTEADTVAPQVTAKTPPPATIAAVNTNLVYDILDLKSYPGNISGTGVASTTCRIRVSSPSFASTVYQYNSAGVTVTPIDYGYRFTINPATDFGQNETVSVSLYDCQDLAAPANTMITDNYTFLTADTDAPFIDGQVPANDASMNKSDPIIFHLKDTGTGVNLANTVVYVNGNYYTNAGGAGSVTTVGTKITYASSYNFHGGNYAGDTTGISGTANDYTFTIKPQGDFTVGEAVPVIIYSRDQSNNLMERVVYSAVVAGATCQAGSSYCGANTSWNGSQCVGSGGGGGGGCGGGGGGTAVTYLTVNESNMLVTQVNENTVLVTWYTSLPSYGYVVYDSVQPTVFGASPYYGYKYMTATSTSESIYHSVTITGLKPDTLYYFLPIASDGGQVVRGSQLAMSPKFEQKGACAVVPAPVCPVCKLAPAPKPKVVPKKPAKPAAAGPTITSMGVQGKVINILGTGAPGTKINIIIY